MKNKICFLMVLMTLICLVGWTTQAQLQRNNPTRQTWEYLEVELDSRFQATPKLNQYGNDGWELVGVTSSCASSPNQMIGCRYWAYMKRVKG